MESPKATMFVWAKLPDRFLNIGSLEFSKLLLKYGKVAVAPGIGFGENGEGFVRIGLVENEYRIRQAIKNIKLFFDNYKEKIKMDSVKDFSLGIIGLRNCRNSYN